MIKGICIFLSIVLSAVYFTEPPRIEYPDYFPAPEYDFTENVITQEKLNLGRALFYDPILSENLSISCSSCHSPYNAFAHTDHALSHGIHDQIGERNAPALFNLAWSRSFMWDGSIKSLDHQALAPIEHPKEMGSSLPDVISRLESNPLYHSLIKSAYGDGEVTGERILKSIAQFQLSLISDNAKYDQVLNGSAEFTSQERIGYNLFQENCNSCHTEPLFTSGELAMNGMRGDDSLHDLRKPLSDHQQKISLLFKIPSLRNLAYTYPYMHDGRFNRLSEVVHHYSERASHADDPRLKAISLSDREEKDLIAFLLTLTDTSFIKNTNHHFPRSLLLAFPK